MVKYELETTKQRNVQTDADMRIANDDAVRIGAVLHTREIDKERERI